MRGRGNMIVRRGNGVGVGVRRGRGLMIDVVGMIGGVEVVGGIGVMIGEIGVGGIGIVMKIGIEIEGGAVMTIIVHDNLYLAIVLSHRLAYTAFGAPLITEKAHASGGN